MDNLAQRLTTLFRPLALSTLTLGLVGQAAAVELHLTESGAGTVLTWTGGRAPHDVVRGNLNGISQGAALIELGPVTIIECGSADASTVGNEDPEIPPVGDPFFYLVRGPHYGFSTTCLERRATPSSDCDTSLSRNSISACVRWNSDYPVTVTDIWSGNATPADCDSGTLEAASREDALRRTNLYRWLVDLPPVVESAAHSADCQEAAVILRALDDLSHDPDPGTACWTTAGRDSAASSNIGAGYSTLSAAVDGYMRDVGLPGLGHRRWLLFPRFAETGFGFVDGTGGRFRSWMAQQVFGWGPEPSDTPEFIAYPQEGAFPADGVLGEWSFQLESADFGESTVTVTRACDGTEMTVNNASERDNRFGWHCLAWSVVGATAGEEYVIRIEGVDSPAGGPNEMLTYEYRVFLLDC